MESLPGKSGVILCEICEKFSLQSEFAGRSCRLCLKWFKLNVDDFYHQSGKNICLDNCIQKHRHVSCSPCRIKKFIDVTGYKAIVKDCSSCGKKTILGHRKPKCSHCRKQNRTHKQSSAIRKCVCGDASQCSCGAYALNKQFASLQLASFSENMMTSTSLPSVTESIIVPITPNTENAEATDQVTRIHVDLSAIPEIYHFKAKEQLAQDPAIFLTKLALPVNPILEKQEETRTKRKKRSRNDSLSRYDNTSFPVDKCNWKSRKQSSIDQQTEIYNVKNVSDTRLLFQKPIDSTSLAPSPLLQSDQRPLRITSDESDCSSQESHYHHSTSNSIIDHQVSEAVVSLSYEIGSTFPRKNRKRHNSVSTESVKQTEINHKPCPLSLKKKVQVTTVDKTTQTDQTLEKLERRIAELECIIATSRPLFTSNMLGGPHLHQKSSNPEDGVSVLSTPPSSDGMLSANEEVDSSSIVGSLDKQCPKDVHSKSAFQISGLLVKNNNPSPSKLPVILVSRLTAKDLKQHGVCREASSVSSADYPPLRKRPRLSSSPSSPECHEASPVKANCYRASKSADSRVKLSNGTRKAYELFGDDSDDSELTSNQPEVSSPEKMHTFNPDALDYDFGPNEEGTINSSCLNGEANVEDQQNNNKSTGVDHRRKSSKVSRKERSKSKEKNNKKDTKMSDKANKSLKELREKKDQSRKGKESSTNGTSGKWRIPKKTNSHPAFASSSVGLPPLLQENLIQNQKGTVPTHTLIGEKLIPPTPNPELPAKHNLGTDMNNSNSVSPLPIEKNIEVVEPTASSETFEISSEATPSILCVIPQRKPHPKSVAFSEQLISVRNISPRSKEESSQQIAGTSSFPGGFISTLYEDLKYVPESSARPVITGIRPFHPPARKIENEKPNPPSRGGRRFLYSSSSSTSSSQEDSSDDELVNGCEMSSATENREEIVPDKLSSSCSTTKKLAVVSNIAVTDLSTIESHESTNGEKNLLGIRAPAIPSTQQENKQSKSASNIFSSDDGLSSDTDKECCSVMSPKKVQASPILVPTSQNKTPENVGPIPSTVESISKAVGAVEVNQSDDEDILDIGLDYEETFGFDFVEEDGMEKESLKSQETEKVSTNEPTDNMAHTSPVKENQPSTQIISTPPVTSTDLPKAPAASNALFEKEGVSETRICFDYIENGQCKLGEKCSYSHNLELVLLCLQRLSHSNTERAAKLVRSMAAPTSPMSQNLFTETGKMIVGTVIKTIIQKRRVELWHYAVGLLAYQSLPIVFDLIEPVINGAPSDARVALQMTQLHKRIVAEKLRIRPSCWNKIIKIFHNILEWNMTYGAVEAAIECSPNYEVAPDVLDFLFRDPRLFEAQKLNLLKDQRNLKLLSKELCREILERLKDLRLINSYENYSHIFSSPASAPNGENDFGMISSNELMQSTYLVEQYLPPIHEPPPMKPIWRAPNMISTRHPPPQGVVNQYGNRNPMITGPGRAPFLHDDLNPEMMNRPPPSSIQYTNWNPMEITSRPPPVAMQYSNRNPLQTASRPTTAHLSHGVRTPMNGNPRTPQVLPPYAVRGPVEPVRGPVEPVRGPVEPVRGPVEPVRGPVESVRSPVEPILKPIFIGNGVSAHATAYQNSSSMQTNATRELLPINKKPSLIGSLDVPKPTYSLDSDLFSPLTEASKLTSSPNCKSVEGPNVIVEPAYGMVQELQAEFEKQNFETVTRLFLQYFSGTRACRLLASLGQLIVDRLIEGSESNNYEKSIGETIMKIFCYACRDGGANTLPSLHLQALRELSYYVLFHFYKLNNNESTDAEKNLRNAKFFLKSMDLFHIHVIDFVSDPYLLLFVAECFIVEDEYPEQSIEEYLEQIMPDIFQALFFLTEFHKGVAEVSVDPETIQKENYISASAFNKLTRLERLKEYQKWKNLSAGFIVDFQAAFTVNLSRFRSTI